MFVIYTLVPLLLLTCTIEIHSLSSSTRGTLRSRSSLQQTSIEECDVAVIGSGIGGLTSAAILSKYGLKVHLFESHYRPGGCAHSFPIKSREGTTYQFDAGPTILLGCSSPPYSPLRQVLDHVGASIDWIPYDSWGMVDETGQWDFTLGENVFESGGRLILHTLADSIL